MTEHVRLFARNAHALEELLRDLASLFTYDAGLRPHLGEVWGHAMAAALDAVDDGADFHSGRHWADWAIGGLLLTPHLKAGDSDPDKTLLRARSDWAPPDNLAELIDRWLPIALREPKAADALAQLAKCGPMLGRATTTLYWTERVVDGCYERFANRCWYLTEWLGSVRASGIDSSEDLARWRRLVDGLSGAGDSGAADLQRLEE